MNKFLTSLLFIVLLSFCTTSPELKGFDKQAWLEDTDGCNGDRESIIETIISQEKTLLGKDQDDIIELLGKPNMHELYRRSQTIFTYSINATNKCKQFISGQKQTYLTLRFNALGRVNEIIYYK